MMSIRSLTVTAFAATILTGTPFGATRAVFHLAVIDEVMTSYGGDPSYQFVEIKMLASNQNLVQNTILASFDATGTHIGNVLLVPGNVTNHGANVRWLMASAAFNMANPGLADFVWPGPTMLPTTGGMVCWGAMGAGASTPNSHVDCVSYGTYAGPSNNHTSAPTTLTGEGHSLVRIAETNSSLNDFACGDPANPTNNAGASVSLPATSACPAPPTATTTATRTETTTATATGTETTTATTTPTITPTSTPIPGCPVSPAAGCATPGKSILRLKTSGSKIVWKWLKGTATAAQFGDPVGATNGYHLCIYEDSALLTGTTIAGGGMCGGVPCWATIGGGFKYKNVSPGITKVIVKEGTAKAKVLVKGKDASATVPVLPLAPATDVRVQLLNTGSSDCWEATYPAANVAGDADKLKAQIP